MLQKIQILAAIVLLGLAASLALVYNASASDNPYYSERIGVTGCSNTRYYALEYGKRSTEDILWDKVSTGGGHTAAWADVYGEGAVYWGYFQDKLEELGAKAVIYQICLRSEWTSATGMTTEQQAMLTTIVNHIRELTSADTDVYVLPLNYYEDPFSCSAVGPYSVPNSVELADWAAATGLALRGPDTGPLTPAMVSSDGCHPNGAGKALGAQQFIDFFDNQPPTVSITSPVADEVVSGNSVVIQADAVDDNGVARVDFLVDGNLLSSDTTAPYEATWDTTLDYDGPFTLTALAVDTTDKTTEHVVNVTTNNGWVNTAPVALIADDGDDTISSQESLPVTFDGTGSFDNEGQIVSYEWNFGDGTPVATGSLVEHTYSLAGSYTATLTVTDDGGLVGTDTVQVELGLDQAPTVSITNPLAASVVAGTVNFSADAADDNSVASVAFYVDNVLLATDTTAPYETLWDTTLDYDGQYTVRAEATDNIGQMTNQGIVVTVTNGNVNTHPTAVINDGSGTAITVREGVNVNFDGKQSHDDEGTVVSYAWDFGDGGSASGDEVAYSFDTPGQYTVTLTVVDDGGLSDTASIDVTVNPDTAPTVSFTNLIEGSQVSGNVVIDATAADDIAVASVDFYVNGNLLATDAIAPFSATWDSTVDYDGAYVLSLTATDSIGQTTTAAITVNVVNGFFNTNPTAIIADQGNNQITVDFGQAITFDGSASFDNETVIASYVWDFGDGSAPVNGQLVNYSYPIAGTYTATLTVTDDEGLSGSDTVEVVVNQPAGGLTASVNPAVTGQVITFTDSDNTASFRRRWFMGNGTMLVTNSGNSVDYSYSTPGTYTVELETKDLAGNRITLSLVVVVN